MPLEVCWRSGATGGIGFSERGTRYIMAGEAGAPLHKAPDIPRRDDHREVRCVARVPQVIGRWDPYSVQHLGGGTLAQNVSVVVWQSAGCLFNPVLGASKCPRARHPKLLLTPIAVGV